MAIIRAAGGLLWRTGKDGRRRLAVIHRPHREDWSLPKGKLKEGERWEEAALREVEEETGCRARIVSFAGAVHYVPKRTPKVVLFWNMELVSEGPLRFLDEVDEVVWLTRGEALKRRDHKTERALLVEALELERAPRAEAAPLDTSQLEAATGSAEGAPDSPPPLRAARPRIGVPAAAGAVTVLVASAVAYWAGPPGSLPVALAAAAAGALAAGGASALARPWRGRWPRTRRPPPW